MSKDSKTIQRGSFRRTQGSQFGTGSTPKSRKQTGNKNLNEQLQNSQADHDEDDSDLCIICADKLKYVALSPCSHKTCHKCAFRQRALYEKKTCLICRTENERLTFTDLIHAEYDSTKDFADRNEQYGIDFTSTEVAKATLQLLSYDCSLCSANETEDFGSFKKLNEHLRNMHSKNICMICATHRHAFPCELKIYTPNQLRNHQSRGESKGFKGHPMCAFCSGRRFYSDDELYVHMRHQHERCHICDKLNPSSPQYFKDYDQLFDHFKNCHYICTVQNCLDNKFVVFADELELQAHILKEHGDIIRGKPKLFQSELSTFISAPSRVIREGDFPSNSLGSSTSRRKSPTESQESLREKKLRLEERAKYYLAGSQADYDTFSRLTEDYDKGRLSARGLLDAYSALFISPEADVYLLIHNVAETYSPSSSKYKDLNYIYQTHEQQTTRRNELPSLSRDPSASARIVGGVWSANNNSVSTSHGRNVDTRNLPTLKSPPASHDPFTSPYRSQSFKNLATTRKKSPSPVVKNAPSNNTVQLTPRYLETKQKSASSSSLTGNNKLAALDLPSLPKPKPKFVPPPVNQPKIPDPKKWGQKTSQLTDELADLGLNSSSSNGKKKGKQKQLLFHIGI